MDSPTPTLRPDDLPAEIDARLVQALDNFFQRSRPAIHDGIERAMASEPGASMLNAGQTCMDWLATHPDRLSDAFARHYRTFLAEARPATHLAHGTRQTGELQLLDEATLDRQLADSKAGQRLTDVLLPDLQPFLARMSALLDQPYADVLARYSPVAMVHALSDAFDTLELEEKSGTLLLQQALPPLQDTLRHTYAALSQFLESHGIEPRKSVPLPAPASRAEPAASAGSEVLAHIQRSAESGGGSRLPGLPHMGMTLDPMEDGPQRMTPAGAQPGPAPAGSLDSFQACLDHWQIAPPAHTPDAGGAPVLVLRQLQAHAQTTDAAQFDLAMLDAVASLFEILLDDPGVSACYKSVIAQLQIPALRVALASSEFFVDDSHPARRTLDLLGVFSRRFPETHPSFRLALAEVEAACVSIVHQPARQSEAFADAHRRLVEWFDAENARADTALAAEVANLEQIERQELGTLLALENLQDLTARYPAPASVLRQLELAWVPFMASLYVEESGEGPAWREAGATLLNLFLSLQPPEDAATREKRLQMIPEINRALRNGLVSQQADPAQLRAFFAAITATQECWIRPDLSHPETPVSRFEPSLAVPSAPDGQTRRGSEADTPDPAWQQAEALREGDWVDFSPPYEGLDTARVAWVGVQGYLLFCDSQGETRFSLDTARLAEAIRAGQASIPEQSLTRKAMLRLKEHLQTR